MALMSYDGFNVGDIVRFKEHKEQGEHILTSMYERAGTVYFRIDHDDEDTGCGWFPERFELVKNTGKMDGEQEYEDIFLGQKIYSDIMGH
jgi:hypothetical protein